MDRKFAIICGASKGIGLHIAQHLATRFRLFLLARSFPEPGQAADSAVASSFPRQYRLDSRDPAKVAAMADRIRAETAQIHLLINVVGDYLHKPIRDVTFPEWDHLLRSNLDSAFLMCRDFLPLMRDLPGGAQIINFGYTGCERVVINPMTVPYSIAKTGLYILTKALAESETGHNVRVNMISPGVIENSLRRPPNLPAGKVGRYADILQAVDVLLDEKSRYLNGANLEVSGGWRPICCF
jgi:NAD(P)-dependent dehydrogenase (short-subunit alcohol dehydrogenase family)